MEIIPVLDLMNGLAVHARLGQRADYRPLESRLCDGPEPADVVAGLLRLHPFRSLYVADLDALMGGPPQTAALESLRSAFPDLGLWVDRGLAGEGRGLDAAPAAGAVPVVGSESLRSGHLQLPAGRDAQFVLSLDFRESRLDGPAELLARPDWWPERVILMNLARVGGSSGPNFEQAAAFRRAHPGHRFVAAGGVRDATDLARLADLGLSAVLLASALHSGAVGAEALEKFG